MQQPHHPPLTGFLLGRGSTMKLPSDIIVTWAAQTSFGRPESLPQQSVAKARVWSRIVAQPSSAPK
eukprot:2299103-Amphidinium_carterae.1